LSPSLTAQTPDSSSKVPFVRVRWNETTLHITYLGKQIEHDVSTNGNFVGVAIRKVTTQRLFESNGQLFMLLDVEGPSRGPTAAMGYCGAGEEKALVLFRMDADGLLVEPQVVNYESCFRSIESLDDQESEGERKDTKPAPITSHTPVEKGFTYTRLRGPADPKDYAANREWVTVEVTFDPVHPELGLVTKEYVVGHKTSASSQ